MSRDQQPGERDDEPEADEYFDDRPRSIFSALWFRVLLAVLVLGVLAAVAVPYMLDLATHSASDSRAAKRPAAATSPAVTPPTAQPAATAPPAPASPAVAASTTAPSPPAASTPSPPSAPSIPPPAAMSTPAERAKTSESTRATAPPARKTTAAAKPATVAVKSRETATERPRVAASEAPATATSERTSTDGPYWVQVGAFRDAEAAARVVTRLRGQGFRAEQSTTGKPAAAAAPADAPGDRYAVVVSGGAPGDLDAKLAAKGMTSEATPGGAIVQPSLPLREAVALSRELADAGLSVQVRRQGPPAPSAPARGTAETWHRVRVGGFPDRAAAVASFKKLEEKGYKPFIATGNN